MKAWKEEIEVDSEKAFFVADLSVVYNQFWRWKRTMPRVEPFFGKFLFIYFIQKTEHQS